MFRVTLFAEPPIRLDALKQFSCDYWCMVAIGAIFTLARFSEAGKVKIRSGTSPEVRSIGYNRAYLDDYRPNKTFYLSSEIRTKLWQDPLRGERPTLLYGSKGSSPIASSSSSVMTPHHSYDPQVAVHNDQI